MNNDDRGLHGDISPATGFSNSRNEALISDGPSPSYNNEATSFGGIQNINHNRFDVESQIPYMRQLSPLGRLDTTEKDITEESPSKSNNLSMIPLEEPAKEEHSLMMFGNHDHHLDIPLQDYEENRKEETDELINNAEIILLKNVHKTYLLGVEGVTALRGVTLSVREKEFICILGTSGGGKTTMLNIIGTIDKPTKGEVYIDGHKIKSSTEDKYLAGIRLNKLAFVFQTFNLLSSLTALENVELPMTLRGDLSRGEIRKRALRLLEDVGLKERVNHFPNQLSGGEQQRVTIARALSNEPKILLLDEPTGDLDTKNSDLIMNTIVDLNMKKGITIIMVTHDIGLKHYAHRVVRMVDGKINKIERNSKAERMHVINQLKTTIQVEYKINVDANIEVPRSTTTQSVLGVREGARHSHPDEANNSSLSKFKYEFRKPQDYAAINFDMTEKAKLHH
jgi:putative ABC transport system ATP-binding protein